MLPSFVWKRCRFFQHYPLKNTAKTLQGRCFVNTIPAYYKIIFRSFWTNQWQLLFESLIDLNIPWLNVIFKVLESVLAFRIDYINYIVAS